MASKVAASMRTVLLKVSPAPSNLSERRAILRALKQHGEIDVFKKLHDPSAFISVVTSHATALGLIARSPLQFDYVCEQGQQAAAPNKTKTKTKTFTVGIWEKPDYGHNTRIRQSQIYGPWPEQDSLFQQNSFATAALRRSVPPSMAWNGLVDWETSGQQNGQVTLAPFLSTKEDYIQARRIRQSNKTGFKSLVETYNKARNPTTEGDEGGNEGNAGRPQSNTEPRSRSTQHTRHARSALVAPSS